jgi:hypothetical protein
MFPTAAPGAALFILRLLVAATFAVDGMAHLAMVTSFWSFLGFALPALFLCFGFPNAILLRCLLPRGVGYALFISGSDSFRLVVSIASAGLLMILGPGAYSIDARIFGRRLLMVRPRR